MSRNHPFVFLAALMIVGWAWLAAARPTLAHSSNTVGPYTLVVGWVHEPPLVGERNAILLIVTETASKTPVIGVEANLTAQVMYGRTTFRGNLNPTAVPGEYTLELIPTVRGQYNLYLSGRIGETDVEITVEPEEVFAAARLQFPEAPPDTLTLNQQITTLETQLRQTRILAFISIGVGLLGLILAGVSWWKKGGGVGNE
ncbi:MAG: hypothetical protein KJ063_21195 [Anaerolineae bacterium]|nr:hypothetical protein [Anaerolineae bacterium]